MQRALQRLWLIVQYLNYTTLQCDVKLTTLIIVWILWKTPQKILCSSFSSRVLGYLENCVELIILRGFIFYDCQFNNQIICWSCCQVYLVTVGTYLALLSFTVGLEFILLMVRSQVICWKYLSWKGTKDWRNRSQKLTSKIGDLSQEWPEGSLFNS